jgi:hypothetical protein
MGWVTVPNALIEDDSISPQAFRLLTYMLTKRGNWRFRQTHLCKIFKVQRDTMTRWYKELRDAGYLYCTATVDKKNGNKRVWTYLVFPLPMALYYQVIDDESDPKKAGKGVAKIIHIENYIEQECSG